MNTNEFAKKIAVLVSGDNKIWGTSSFCQENICKNTIGANYTTIQTWLTKQGKYPRMPSIVKMCESINKSHIITRKVKELDFSNDRSVRSVFEFAEIFGINRESCCKILDERIYYWEFPLLPCLYYDKMRDDADTDFEKYKGFYDIYRRGTSSHNEMNIYKMKLQVRYVLTAHNRKAIRCKLNIPDVRRELIEYDGFVSELDNYVYWVFEARAHLRAKLRDCIFMLTNKAGSYDENMRMYGIYLSVNQDAPPMPVTRNIVLIRRHEKLNDEDKIKKFMKDNMNDNIIENGVGEDSKIIEKL